ncbi:phage BR0599 family protein [Tistrella bauzanensis]
MAQGGAGMIVPARPLPEPPPPGTAYRLRVGCDRQIETCAGRFRNTLNFRGFPFVPDPGAITRT